MSREIEAKLAVADLGARRRIRHMRSLAGFALTAGRVVEVLDTYLDTPGGAVLSAGYALRRREQPGELLITLKSTTPAAGAVHTREEWETILAADAQPAQWPDSEARRRVLAIIGPEMLGTLFQIRQRRFLRDACDGERRVAAVSLDHVHVRAGGRRQDHWELEIELAPEGREEELALMSEWAQARLGLLPAARSKFERARDLEAAGRS